MFRIFFEEAQRLHQTALKLPGSMRAELMSAAFAKQKEAIEEIQATEKIKNKLKEKHCPETEGQFGD